MEQKIAITKYDKPKAKGFFVLFKALELFGVFLLTFGFYGLGCLVHKHFIGFYEAIFSDTSYLTMWFVGVMTFLLLIFMLGCAVGIGYAIFVIIQAWIKGNWNMAKRFAEDSDAKAKRLKEQEVEEKKEQRLKFGYCVGDEVEIIGALDESSKKFIGTQGKILKINEDGCVEILEAGFFFFWVPKKEFKITKKYPLKIGYAKTGGKK